MTIKNRQIDINYKTFNILICLFLYGNVIFNFN